MFIGLGHISWDLLYPLLYSLGCFSRGMGIMHLKENQIVWSHTLLCSFAELSMGLVILGKKIFGSDKMSDNTSIYEKNNKVLLLSVGAVAITNYIFCFITISLGQFELEYAMKILGIIYIFYIVGKILNINFGNHRKASFIVILICDGVFLIVEILEYFFKLAPKEKPKANQIEIPQWILMIILFIGDIFFSTKHLTEKILMDNKFLTPFHLLFIEGIFNFVINIIMCFFFGFFKCGSLVENFLCTKDNKIFSFSALIQEFRNDYKYLILFFFSTIIVELCAALTNKHLDPTYRSVFDIFTGFLSFNVSWIEGQWGILYPIKIILFCTCIFIGLVYNEIIKIKIYGLDKDLKIAIADRGDKEYVSVFEKQGLFNESEDEGDDR